MKPTFALHSFTLGSSIATLLAATTAHAALVTGWTEVTGKTPVSNMSTASPTLGDGSVDSADTKQISASFGEITLTSVGDSITLSGSATFTGAALTPGRNQFRWGLFDVNGSANDLGWLGYIANQGGGTSGAQTFERSNPTSGTYISLITGATQVGSDATAPGTGINFSTGTYDFLLTLERVATGVQIDSSIIRTSDSQQFGLYSFLDTTPQTYDFNRVGFLVGGNLDADQVQFTNIDVIPEPGAAFLGSLGLLALLRRRRN